MSKEKFNEKKKKMDLEFSSPIRIIESFDEAGELKDFMVQGVAINSTKTENNHQFLSEELSSAAQSLNGVPLLIDHRNEVDAIKGRVVLSEYDEVEQNIRFKAKIMDKNIQQMVKDGRLNSVSIGASVSELEESEDAIIPRGITFKELSLVAVPADPRATFSLALTEAYKSNSSNDDKKIKGGKHMEETKEAYASKESLSKLEEKIEAQSKLLSEVLENLKAKESDADEAEAEPEEEAKEEEKEEAEDKPESKSEESKEEEEEEEEDEEDEVAEEKANYKVVQSYGSLKGGAFSVVRT